MVSTPFLDANSPVLYCAFVQALIVLCENPDLYARWCRRDVGDVLDMWKVLW